MKYFVTIASNISYEIGELSPTYKLGIINWRPIALLTVVYKIATGCIAERIKKFLIDKLISRG